MAKIGVILMVIKKAIDELGVYEAMRKYAGLGYKVAEISQVPMTPENVAEFKRACDDFGIKIGAMSAALAASARPPRMGPDGKPIVMPRQENLTDDYDKIVADCKALGCNYLRIGMLPVQYLQSEETLIEFARLADEMSDKLRKDGIYLYYHTHHFEFRKFNGKFALDIIRDNSTKIGFELDVHWIWRGGMDPVKFIQSYDGRVKLIHLKDYRIGALDFSKGPGAMSDIVQFAEVGEGTLDMPAIIEAGKTAGAEYFFIEQDNTYGRDPFESLEISANNLRKMGFGDMI
ncbi:MAG: sugar phosphate isomerase/epimerase [Clostridia bacterium]|nr:sugar phosphate isomerase/epimerase [Clostridia bacterium]